MKELDSLITGERHTHSPRCSVRQTLRAIWHAHLILALLERRGEPAAFRKLEELPVRRQDGASTADRLLVARHLSATVQRFLRLRAPGSLCLARALAVCAALRSVGVPVQVVIGRLLVRGGRERIANTAQGFEFHAWAELEGRVLTDAPVSRMGHVELVRVPASPC